MKNKKEYDKLYYQQNKERLKKEALERYNNNTEYYKQKFKESYLTETQEQRDKRKQKTVEWIDTNKELVNKKNLEYYYKNKETLLPNIIKYHHNKYKNNPLHKLRTILSVAINQQLKSINSIKNKRSLEIVGLESWELLKEHIEHQWIEGMDWTNYGNKKESWSIDHIIPISTAQTEEEVYKLNHYTNLRPMWHIDNIKKGNKI
jgi:hypothetical protein